MTVPDPAPGDVFARERQEHIARLVEEHGPRPGRATSPTGSASRRSRSARTSPPSRQRAASSGRTAARSSASAQPAPERAFDIRERLQRDEKDAIGRRGGGMVADGESIVFDASTTALAVARHLKARGGWSQLTVITNGLRIAVGARRASRGSPSRCPAASSAGRRCPSSASWATACSTRINVQKAFLGAAGFTLESGLARRDRRGGADQARRWSPPRARSSRIVDHTKWERAAFATFCPTDEIDVVADRRARARRRWSQALASRGIDVRLVGRPTASPTSRPARRDRSTRRPRRDRRRRRRAAARRSCAASRSGSLATQALDDVSLELLPGRGPRPRRRERRRQEHAGQDPRRRPPARQRARSGSTASRSRSTARPRPARSGSPSSTRSRGCSRT